MFNGGASQHIGGFKAPSPSPRMPTPRPHDPYNGHTPAPGPGGFLAPAPPLFTSASDSGVRTVPRPPIRPRTLSAPKLIIPHVSFERPKKSRPPKKEHHHHSHHATHAHHTHHTHHTSTTHLQTTYAPRPEHSHPVPGLVKPPKPAKPVQHVHASQPVKPTHVVQSSNHHAVRPTHAHASRPSGSGGTLAFPTPHMPPTTTQQCGTQHFQYSMCTGRKKALCIGINYRGTPNVLKGCVNDAKNVRSFLIRYYEYRSEDIVLLTDDGKTPRERPTRQNMIDAMKWLVRDARPHDSLVFHYSGHGAQIRDRNGDEVDGYDELVFPLDHKKNGHILDDEMHEIMVKPLPSGCRLTAIFDSCHSGSALDLPFIYSSNGSLKEVHAINESGRPVALSGGGGDVNRILRKARLIRQSPADVISWSGCKDSQTSADTTTEAGNATGAMSYAFTSCLKANQNQSYQELLVNIREILRRRYKQKPQLSSSHPIDTNLLFIA